MTVEQMNVIDLIGTDRETGDVILTISDHLDWSDSVEHQRVLQEKLNKYLAFVERGEIFERYPDAKDRLVMFRVVFKYRPDRSGRLFLKKAKEIIEDAGFSLSDELFAESWNN
jgi:hypothetical protein